LAGDAGEKRQHMHSSGKKRRHTPKAQLIANLKTEEILATDFCNGSQHGFRLFRNGCSLISPNTCILADSDYQDCHNFTQTAKHQPRKANFIR